MENKNESVLKILKELKEMKIAVSKIEKDLGFSNGLLKKGKLSNEKFEKLINYAKMRMLTQKPIIAKGEWIDLDKIQPQTDVLEARIKELEAENRKLRSEIEGLKSAKIALKNDSVQVTNLVNDKNTNYSVNTVENRMPKGLSLKEQLEWREKNG